MPRLKSIAANGLLLLVSIVIALGIGEAMLRTFKPVEMRLQGNRIQLTTNHKLIIENEKYEKLDKVIRHTKNAIGFRGDNPPLAFDQHLTVMAVGGSTTECYYLSDGDTWPERMVEPLNKDFRAVWVNNAGLDGHSTYGHAYIMRDYIAAIKPKLVTFLVGVNDVGLDKSSPFDNAFINVVKFWRDQPVPEKPSLWQAIRSRKQVLNTLAQYSHVVNLGLTIGRSLAASKGGLGHGQLDFKTIPPVGLTAEQRKAQLDEQRQKFIPLFEQRLTQLIEVTKALEIEAVLITQPALWGRGIDPATGVDLGPISDFYWDRLELYNDVTRRVGAEKGVPVIDLARQMPKDSTYFYDWFHYTKPGAAKVGEIVAAGLEPILAAKFPQFKK